MPLFGKKDDPKSSETKTVKTVTVSSDGKTTTTTETTKDGKKKTEKKTEKKKSGNEDLNSLADEQMKNMLASMGKKSDSWLKEGEFETKTEIKKDGNKLRETVTVVKKTNDGVQTESKTFVKPAETKTHIQPSETRKLKTDQKSIAKSPISPSTTNGVDYEPFKSSSIVSTKSSGPLSSTSSTPLENTVNQTENVKTETFTDPDGTVVTQVTKTTTVMKVVKSEGPEGATSTTTKEIKSTPEKVEKEGDKKADKKTTPVKKMAEKPVSEKEKKKTEEKDKKKDDKLKEDKKKEDKKDDKSIVDVFKGLFSSDDKEKADKKDDKKDKKEKSDKKDSKAEKEDKKKDDKKAKDDKKGDKMDEKSSSITTVRTTTHTFQREKHESGMEKSLVDALTGSFDRQEACDVIFRVEEKNIGAHKIVLAARCQLLHDMAKDWTTTAKPIPVDGIDCKSFVALLRFLYCGVIALSNTNALVCLAASIKFKIDSLEKICVDHIAKSMDKDNVSWYMNEAVEFQSDVLQKMCLETFEKETKAIIKSQPFEKLSQPALSAFLDADKINVLEISLFHRVLSWMKEKCREQGLAITGENMRGIIGDAILKIRFPTMTSQDFANSVSTIEGLLSDKEKLQIFQMIMVFDNKNIECPFSNQFRCQKSNFYVPMQDMRQLLKEKVLYRLSGEPSFNVKSLMDRVENLGEGCSMFPGSFRLLVQCIADIANTTIIRTETNQGNATARQELSKKLERWEAACTSEKEDVREIMNSFMDFRKALDNLTFWSL